MGKNKPIKMKKLFNPSSEDLDFEYNSAPYRVKAGKSKSFVDYIAVHGAKRLADRNIMTSNPEEHKVLMAAYLENSDPKVVAEGLGIDLDKIREEAMTKEKEKARVVNLESQVATLARQVAKLTEEEPSTVVEEPAPKKAAKPKDSKKKE